MTNYSNVQCLYNKNLLVLWKTVNWNSFHSPPSHEEKMFMLQAALQFHRDWPCLHSPWCCRRRTVPPFQLAWDSRRKRLSSWASPQTDWHIGHHAVTHQRCCFDRPAWPLCFTIAWSQPIRPEVSANGWCSQGSRFVSGWRRCWRQRRRCLLCLCCRFCSRHGCGSFLLCLRYFGESSVWIQKREEGLKEVWGQGQHTGSVWTQKDWI